jgi:hypothetical protein
VYSMAASSRWAMMPINLCAQPYKAYLVMA